MVTLREEKKKERGEKKKREKANAAEGDCRPSVSADTHTRSAGLIPLPLCLAFLFFFYTLHFSILDNTPRIDIKQG